VSLKGTLSFKARELIFLHEATQSFCLEKKDQAVGFFENDSFIQISKNV